MKKIKILFSILIILQLNLFTFSSAFSQEKKIDPTIEKGIGQYKHENYDEALITLKKARSEDPKSTLTAYYLGLTYKQLQDYNEAIVHLKDAVTFSPKIKGALIELIDCYYQIGELDDAKIWIREAEKEGIRPTQTAFLKGLVLLKGAEEKKAITAFGKAKSLDKSMTPACDYQIGICNLRARKYVDARKAFEQVVVVDPSSNMANFANEYINAIERIEEISRPFKFSCGVAWQYDDNVVLKPTDAISGVEIADDADSREVITAKAEFNHRFDKELGLKAQYILHYAKQNDLGFYDSFTHTSVLQPSLYLEDALLTFPISYSHITINDKAYLSTPIASAIYNFMVGTSNMGQIYSKYQYKDYLWDPSTLDEDRDGNTVGGGAGWFFFYAKNKGFLNLRYGLSKDWTEGNNWESLSHRITATVLVPVIKKLDVTISGDFLIQNFTNSHTVYNVYRKDKVYTLSALIAYKLIKNAEIQFQYTFVKDDSNISVYNYNRNIYSIGAEVKF